MAYDRESHIAAEVKDLVKISVRVENIETVIAAVIKDGYYTRELCGKGNIADEPGFSRFDPDTSLGQLSWSQLRRLLFARLKQPACRATEIRKLRDLWLQHIQGSIAADKFFSSDETKYELYEAAGGSYPDNLRIEVTKPRLSPDLMLAFEAFQEMEMCRGVYNPMLEEDWAIFSAAAIRVGMSLLQKSEFIAASPGASPVAPAAPADQRQRNLMPISPEVRAAGSGCWKWSHVGVCSYGDNCRFPHLGTVGAQRHTVTDENGHCLMLKKGTCSRNNCPFMPCSGADASGGAAEDQQQPPAPPAPPAPDARPTGDPACYSPSARAAAQRGRTQFDVLHEDKAVRSRGQKVSSEEFFAPGTRTASGGLKPRWTQKVQEDDSDCEDY
jgi:hypothetical protein